MREGAIAAVVGLLVAILATLGEPATVPLHQLAGRLVASPAMPVTLIQVEGTIDDTVQLTRELHAASVWAAWTDAAIHPGVLDGRDMVVRGTTGPMSDGRPIPAAEASNGLTSIRTSQLVGAPEGFLAGTHVVLLSSQATSTGHRSARELAVAVGTHETGSWLKRLPVAPTTSALALLASLLTLLLRRTGGPESLFLMGLGLGTTLGVLVLARSLGIVAPAMGMIGMVALPSLLQVARATIMLGLGRSIALEGDAPWIESENRAKLWLAGSSGP